MARRSIRNSLDLSIKTSLVVVVVFLLLTLASVSVLAKLRLGALERTIDTVGRERLPRIRALGEIDVAVTRMRLSSIRAALTVDPAQRVEIEALITSRMNELEGQIAALKNSIRQSPEQLLLFSSFVGKWNVYQGYQTRILQAGLGGDKERIGRLVNVETLGPFQNVIDAINDGIKLANQQADQVIEAANAQSSEFSAILWAANAVSILVSLAALNFVMRDVSLPLRRITESMEQIARGHPHTEIPFADRRNELGLMARALTVFRKSLAENERLGAATRTLSEL